MAPPLAGGAEEGGGQVLDLAGGQEVVPDALAALGCMATVRLFAGLVQAAAGEVVAG